MKSNQFFEDILNKYDLGHLRNEPVLLSEDLLYKSYKLDTSSGDYVIKLIDRDFINKKHAIKVLEKENKMEDLLSDAGVCAEYQIAFNENKLLEADGYHFCLAKWFDGLPLSIDDVTQMHCKKAAEQLARIHNIDFKDTEEMPEPFEIDFDYFVRLCNEMSSPVSKLLNDHLELIKETLSRSNEAIKNTPMIKAVCHNDYDLKSVLWHNEQFRIIDLEAVGYNNPFEEILSSALSWSGGDRFCFDEKLFDVFISTYFNNSRLDLKVNWPSIYDSNTRHLSSLKNDLIDFFNDGISKEEKDTVLFQLNNDINMIIYLNRIREKVLHNKTMNSFNK